MSRTDANGRAYALASECRVGTVLETDDGFDCMPAGARKVVLADEHGRKYIECDDTRHYLEGQLDRSGALVGLYPVKDAPGQMRRCIIVDVDNTIADNSHRKHHLMEKPKNRAAWLAEAHLCRPIASVIIVIEALRGLGEVVLCSGRMECERAVTVATMEKFGFQFAALYMRKDNDFRSDDVVKREMLAALRADGFDPFLVFDDRDRVVKMWREEGLRCFQVADGDF